MTRAVYRGSPELGESGDADARNAAQLRAEAMRFATSCTRDPWSRQPAEDCNASVSRRACVAHSDRAPCLPASGTIASMSGQHSEFTARRHGLLLRLRSSALVGDLLTEEKHMSKEAENKLVVGRWFTEFWGEKCDLAVVDEIAAPDMLLKYSLHAPRRGREDIKTFMTDFRAAFPDLQFWGTADLIAEGEYVVGQWEGGGTHTGPAFSDFLRGSLPAATGRKMHFTGTTVLRVRDGQILEEVGLDDGVTALTQLGLLRAS